MLSKDQLLKRIATGCAREGLALEFKESWKDQHGHSLSAMANRQGGWLVVGIDDNGQPIGVTEKKLQKQKDALDQHIGQYLQPSCAVQDISLEHVNGQMILLIEVINPKAVTLWRNKCYKRVGASTQLMRPGEHKQLELQRPDLDYSSHPYSNEIDEALVLDFAKFLRQYNGGWKNLSANEVLSKLNIKNKNAAGILFGDFEFRLIYYNEQGELMDHYDKKGLYNLLKDDFIQNIQSRSRKKPLAIKDGSLTVEADRPYAELSIREALVNAVAHAAFEYRQGGVKVEVFLDRLVISNYCAQEAEAFVNKRLAPDSSAYNPLLMKVLRMAHFSEETGSGKGKIFKHTLENGQEEPLFECQQMPKDRSVWRLTLYNTRLPEVKLQALSKIKEQYKHQTDKYQIAAALVLWAHKPLKIILNHIDNHYKKILLSVLEDDSSPFYVYIKGDDSFFLKTDSPSTEFENDVYIYLKKWSQNKFLPGDERALQNVFRAYAYKGDRNGRITNREIKNILYMEDSKSSQIQVARLCQRLQQMGVMEHKKSSNVWYIKPLSSQYNSWLDGIKNLESFKSL